MAPSSRLLSFEAKDVALELEIVVEGTERRLVGQIVPPRPGVVEVHHRRGSELCEADAVGRFSVASIAPGLFRLTVRPRATRTRWRRPGSRCDHRSVSAPKAADAEAISAPALARRALELVATDPRAARRAAEAVIADPGRGPEAEAIARRALGMIARDTNDLRTSVEQLRRAIRVADRAGLARLGAEARMSLAPVLAMQGSGSAAVAECDRAAASSPASPAPASRPSGPPSSTSSWAAPTTPSPATPALSCPASGRRSAVGGKGASQPWAALPEDAESWPGPGPS